MNAKKELILKAWKGASEINRENNEPGVNAGDALEWLADKYLTDLVNGVEKSDSNCNTTFLVCSLSSSVRFYKLECLTEDGDTETNGYYKTREKEEYCHICGGVGGHTTDCTCYMPMTSPS
jgi:hypothetical protein